MVATKFKDQHLEAFQTMACPGEWEGRSLSRWIKHLPVAGLQNVVLAEPLTRSRLKDLCADSGVPNRDILWATLAWGGMKIDAATRMAPNEEKWAGIVGQFRQGNLDRSTCYMLCSEAVSGVQAGGIGPAYFTAHILRESKA